jgi:hypothetical protein
VTDVGENEEVESRPGRPAAPRLVWLFLVIAALLWTGSVAIWLGVQDVAWPVSLTAQTLGGFFMVAGLAALAGAGLLVTRPKLLLLPPDSGYGKDQIGYIAGAALAGCYVTTTIVAHSFRYEQLKALVYAALAVLCVALAVQTLRRAWGVFTKSVKGLGITLGVLGGLANFWYQSFYLPENTQVGIQYGLSVVSVVSSGSGRIVTLDLTMENQSSVTTLTLGSMVTVAGLTFPAKSAAASGNAPQENIDKYAESLVSSTPWSAPPNPNIGSTGNPSGTILTVMRPVNNNSLLFPDDVLSRDFDVFVPKSSIKALDIELTVVYARTTRMTLGSGFKPAIITTSWCANDEQSPWFINQSALVRYTRGAQIFYSDWCASATNPSVRWGVQNTEITDTGNEVYEIENALGIERSTRNEIFTLPS